MRMRRIITLLIVRFAIESQQETRDKREYVNSFSKSQSWKSKHQNKKY